jgi:phycobilisome core-membrane linker protein
MTITFVNPVVNPDAKLAVRPFDDADPVRLWPNRTLEDVEIAIRAVYRQVLGNAHVMESERLSVSESQLKQGEISIREFVRQVAKSGLYRSRFLEDCPRYRAIELNFKHLLGRAPESYEEMTQHSHLLDRAGYEADIDSYIDSEEYEEAFGEDIVPYYRGYKTQTGKKMVGFTHIFQLLRGASSSDRNFVKGDPFRLQRAILKNEPTQIWPVTSVASLPQYTRPSSPSPAPATSTAKPVVDGSPAGRQSQFYEAYRPFKETEPVELRPGFSEAEIDVVIRAAYRQVLGNAHVMESERLVVAESQVKRGEIGVREFVRKIAQSELYRSRFFDNCYRYRAIELNFKHLLGRAPDSFEEMRSHSTILDNCGFEGEIDSYLDSEEYQSAFGENRVPFYRGHKTQPGQSLIGFTNMFQLLRSASSSDKNLETNNKPVLTKALIGGVPAGKSQLSDVSQILADLFKRPPETAAQVVLAPSVPIAFAPAAPATTEQEQQIAALEQQLAQLRSTAGVGAAIVNSSSYSAADSQRQPGDRIAQLQAQIAEARALSSVADYRLNKWRNRTFSR